MTTWADCPKRPRPRSEMEIRRERTLAILKKLADRGIEIAPEETGKTGEFMGRMYLAEALCRRGWADSVRDAFNRYIGDGAPCYVPRRRKPVADGIRALRELGAVPVLAHPARSGISPEALQRRLGEWMDAGLLGVEAWHASHMPVDAERFDALARRNGLLVTGGSDCHGRDDDGGSSRGSHAGIGEKLDGWKTVAEDVPLCAFDEIQKSLEQEIKKGRVRKIYEISLGYIFYCEPGVYVPDSGEYDYADIFYYVKPMWRVNCLKASGAQKELEEAYSDGTVTDDERNTVAYTQFLVDAQTGEIIGQSDAADRSMFPGFLTWEDVNK